MGLTDVRWELVVVQAEQTNLESVLEGKKQYAVPLFQRTYAWRPKHVDRLWTDLIDIARVRRTTPDAPTSSGPSYLPQAQASPPSA